MNSHKKKVKKNLNMILKKLIDKVFKGQRLIIHNSFEYVVGVNPTDDYAQQRQNNTFLNVYRSLLQFRIY